MIFSIVHFQAWCFSSFENDIHLAQNLIVKNCNNSAIRLMDKWLQNPLTLNQKIECLEVKKNALFFNQEYAAFQETSRKLHQLEKPKKETAKHALYLAEQAFFFHYLTWQDSVLLYMNECQNIIEKNKLILQPNEGAFIHFMLANFELYFGRENDAPIHEKRYFNIDQQFKIAIQYLHKPNLYHARMLSVLYRSWGSRTLDRVTSYRSLSRKEAEERPEYRKKLDVIASSRLQMAADIVPKECANDKISALALQGLMYSNLDQCEKASTIYQKCIQILQSQYGEIYRCPGLKSLCLLLRYKIGNDEKQYGKIPDVDWYIQQLKKIEPIYTAQVLSSEQFRYDTYGSSPLHILSCLLLQQGKNRKNESLLKEGASYYVENYTYRFTRVTQNDTQNKIRQWIEKNELHYHLNKGDVASDSELRSLIANKHDKQLISKIQDQLAPNEIILFKSWQGLMCSNFRLVIGKQKVDWIDCKTSEDARLDPESEPSFDQFKNWAWKNYQQQIEPILKSFPNTNRINIAFNDRSDYECLIDNPSGNQYSELAYLIKKIQFNRIYNLYAYFTEPSVELEKKIGLVSLTQPEFKPLLFTIEMLQNLFHSSFSISQDDGNDLQSAFNTKGIIHLYGHGEIKQLDLGNLQYSIPFYQKDHWQDLRNQKKKFNRCQSMVIFNTCFSGAAGPIYEYDSELHTNLLLQGAPAIVISSIRSEEQASAMIFEKFYHKLEEGYTNENALYWAKREYVENQMGDQCNPYRWQAYKMISRQKIQPFQPLSWWEKLILWLANGRYLFGLPALT